jgi:hypothetical protein
LAERFGPERAGAAAVVLLHDEAFALARVVVAVTDEVEHVDAAPGEPLLQRARRRTRHQLDLDDTLVHERRERLAQAGRLRAVIERRLPFGRDTATSTRSRPRRRASQSAGTAV